MYILATQFTILCKKINILEFNILSMTGWKKKLKMTVSRIPLSSLSLIPLYGFQIILNK